MKKMPHHPVLLFLLALLLVLAGCAPSATPAPATSASTAVPTAVPATVPPTVPPTPQPSNTPKPTLTPMPTKTATPEPTPRPTEPVVLAVISGTGAVVTDNFQLPHCNKAVFNWQVQPSGWGTASLIFRLYNADTGKDTSVVNDMATDLDAAWHTGQNIQALKGGEYYFASENTDMPWVVTIECHDGLAPVASGSLDVTGADNAVTGNYELPACDKSIFHWETAPSDWGTASLIAYLCRDDATTLTCNSIVSDMKTDMEETFTGQAVQRLSGGVYYLIVYNVSGPTWHIRWECKD